MTPRPEIVAESPDVVAIEARALQLAEHLPVPTPVLLAVDATGDRCDVPALAMTLLEGRPVWETRWGSEWLSQAVDAMVTLHDVDARSAASDDVRTPNATNHATPPLHNIIYQGNMRGRGEQARQCIRKS